MSEEPVRNEKTIGVQEFPTNNSEILNNLPAYLHHLSDSERFQIIDTILEYQEIFKDDPGLTNVIEHDVEMINDKPVQLRPYRLNPLKNKLVKKETEYMLQHDLIKPSNSSWSSPVVLVEKV